MDTEIDTAIADIIAAANLDEYDVDAATSGLCGTFALAVKAVVPHATLSLICLTDKQGLPQVCPKGYPIWRHVVVCSGSRLFDVEGDVRLPDLVANYCWNTPSGGGGTLLPISEDCLVELLLSDRKSFDQRWFEKWVGALETGRDHGLNKARWPLLETASRDPAGIGRPRPMQAR